MTAPERVTADTPGASTVDEIVLRGVTVHLEQMDTRSWWGSIRRGDDEIELSWDPEGGLRVTDIIGDWFGVAIDPDVVPS